MLKPFLLLVLASGLLASAHAELRIPAFSAYLDPVSGEASVSEKSGISRWTDPAQKIFWFGELETPGQLHCAVVLKVPAQAVSKLRLTVAGQAREMTVQGGTGPAAVDFGDFTIAQPGYQRFELESLNAAKQPADDVEALILDGPALAGSAHFNLKVRRNAASVHLSYPAPKDAKIAAFYCETTGLEDAAGTFYMACGWHRGYFGMQVNSPSERRIIFSVWDSGNEAVDPKKSTTPIWSS